MKPRPALAGWGFRVSGFGDFPGAWRRLSAALGATRKGAPCGTPFLCRL